MTTFKPTPLSSPSRLPQGLSVDPETPFFPTEILEFLPKLTPGLRVEVVDFHPHHAKKLAQQLRPLGCVADDLVLLPQILIVDGDRTGEEPAAFLGNLMWRYFTNEEVPAVIWVTHFVSRVVLARAGGRGVVLVPKPIKIKEILLALHIVNDDPQSASESGEQNVLSA